MKKIIIAVIFVVAGICFHSEVMGQVHNGGFGFFYSELSPHGTWIELQGGLVVWRPTIIHRGWVPYNQGRWIWTEDGWYWDSYEPFGYIVYHYGRWYYDDYYGWIWVPDYDWAPAWVEWRYDDYYIGWAPLPPYAIFSINVGIHFTYDYYTPYNHWHFVKYNRFCDPYVYNYYVGPKYKHRIFSKTKYRTNYSYYDGRIVNRGVDIEFVRERTGQNIRQHNIQRVSDPKELRNKNGRDKEVVRTFVASRDQIQRNDVKNIEIKKSDRKTSLETSRIEIGRNVERNEIKVRNNENTAPLKENRVIQKNEKQRVIEQKDFNRSNDNNRQIEKNRIENPKKEERVIEKNRVERNNEIKIEKKNPVQRNENNNSNRQENFQLKKREVPKQEIRKDIKQENRKEISKIERNNQNQNEQEIKRMPKQESPRIERQNNDRNETNKNSNRNSTDRKR